METMAFGALQISFDGRVLRPPAWTAAQSRRAAEILPDAPPGPVLELCAGAGQIGLLAVHGSDRRLVCVDLNPAACAWTRHNAEAAGVADRVEVREGPMDQVLRDSERFALIVADPPWVRRDDVPNYPEDPVLAIDGGVDGMDVAWLCLDLARTHLATGGTLLLQLGTPQQVDAIRDRLHGDDLDLTDVRWCERGVLVRLDRP